MRILFFLCLLFSVSLARAEFRPMTVKERLRILLWVEGLGEKPTPKEAPKQAPRLPEELEKPLRNF